MGLGKFWLTHGPGSPGSIARAMANAYVRIKSECPELSGQDLLVATLITRYGEQMGTDELEIAFQAVQAGNNLSELTKQVWHHENPMALRAQLDYRGKAAYAQSIQVINDETAKIVG